MDRKVFREKFSEFLGDKGRYQKFVRQLNGVNSNRLKFWQESALDSFSKENGISIPTLEEAQELFRVCEVHGNELQKGEVKNFDGEVDYSSEYSETLLKNFPNSYLDPINGPVERRGKNIEIWYYSECRLQQKLWNDKNA